MLVLQAIIDGVLVGGFYALMAGGLTLGAATGRLLAEIMTGETPFADPTPFAVERFG